MRCRYRLAAGAAGARTPGLLLVPSSSCARHLHATLSRCPGRNEHSVARGQESRALRDGAVVAPDGEVHTWNDDEEPAAVAAVAVERKPVVELQQAASTHRGRAAARRRGRRPPRSAGPPAPGRGAPAAGAGHATRSAATGRRGGVAQLEQRRVLDRADIVDRLRRAHAGCSPSRPSTEPRRRSAPRTPRWRTAHPWQAHRGSARPSVCAEPAGRPQGRRARLPRAGGHRDLRTAARTTARHARPRPRWGRPGAPGPGRRRTAR